MNKSAKGYVVVGVGETGMPLQSAEGSEADWEAFFALASHESRLVANSARNEGGWCVTVDRDDVEEEDLDNDPAVRVYVSPMLSDAQKNAVVDAMIDDAVHGETDHDEHYRLSRLAGAIGLRDELRDWTDREKLAAGDRVLAARDALDD